MNAKSGKRIDFDGWWQTSIALATNEGQTECTLVNTNYYNQPFIISRDELLAAIRMLTNFCEEYTQEDIDAHNEGMFIPTFGGAPRKEVGVEPEPQSVVYLMKMGEYCKIGFTRTSSTKRKTVLQSGSPLPIEIIHEISTPNYKDVERSLHERFASKRRSGEWFALSPDDIEYIKGL